MTSLQIVKWHPVGNDIQANHLAPVKSRGGTEEEHYTSAPMASCCPAPLKVAKAVDVESCSPAGTTSNDFIGLNAMT